MQSLSSYSRRDFLEMFALPVLLQGSVFHGKEMEKLQAMLHGDSPLTWVFTGDSVTQGAHHTYGGRAYPETIGERVRWELRRVNDLVINSGVNGTNTSYLLKHYEWFVLRFRPSVVSVMYGINDCQEPEIPLQVFKENLSEIISRIRSRQSVPILQTPNAIDFEGLKTMKTASRDKLPEYVEAIKDVAKKEQCVLVNHYDQWQEAGAAYIKWLDDPLHPNAVGHMEMARMFFKTIEIFDPAAFTCSGPIEKAK